MRTGKKNPGSTKREVPAVSRPDVYRYHDYRQFLNDWLAFRKATEPDFSLRGLARKANVAVGYLSMMLSGGRRMPREILDKLAEPLGLTAPERSYLELLRTVADAESPSARHDALERLRRFRSYRELNAKEIEVYRYLTHWYYVAIREMANLKDFRLEPKWIRKQLRNRVTLKEVEEALSFLMENGYLEKNADGSVKVPEKELLCLGGIYRLALARFHREMLNLAAHALETVPLEERDVTGYTLSIPKERFEDLKKMCFDFLRQVSKLEQESSSADTVYHLSLAAIPLTKAPTKEKK